MIRLSNICKDYKISKRDPGLKSAIKSLFNKEYETIHALKNISFEINAGEIVGYIGPNGAGKSSTIKVMSGILTPDSGECTVNGKTPWKDRVNHVKDIGVVFGQRSQLWWDVPVGDSFELLKNIYHVENTMYQKRKKEIEELLDIGSLLKTPARQLSLGQRMRCELGASLLHNPKILFLDEPTIGLDAVSKIAVRSFISDINKEFKTTIILTTHDMQDIECLTNRILFIAKGQILLDGSMNMLMQKYSKHKKVDIYYKNKSLPTDILNQNSLQGIEVLENVNGKLSLLIDINLITVSRLVNSLCNSLDILDISITGTSTDEVIASLYKEYSL